MDDLDEFFESLGTGSIESSDLTSDGVTSTDIIGDDELDELFQLSEQLSTKKSPQKEAIALETSEKSIDVSSPNGDSGLSTGHTHDTEEGEEDDEDVDFSIDQRLSTLGEKIVATPNVKVGEEREQTEGSNSQMAAFFDDHTPLAKERRRQSLSGEASLLESTSNTTFTSESSSTSDDKEKDRRGSTDLYTALKARNAEFGALPETTQRGSVSEADKDVLKWLEATSPVQSNVSKYERQILSGGMFPLITLLPSLRR